MMTFIRVNVCMSESIDCKKDQIVTSQVVTFSFSKLLVSSEAQCLYL